MGAEGEGETPTRPVLVKPDRDLDRAALAEPVADDRRLDVLADLDRRPRPRPRPGPVWSNRNPRPRPGPV
jgi:hypothetical protein